MCMIEKTEESLQADSTKRESDSCIETECKIEAIKQSEYSKQYQKIPPA